MNMYVNVLCYVQQLVVLKSVVQVYFPPEKLEISYA